MRGTRGDKEHTGFLLRTGMPGPDEDGAATCRPVPARRGRPAQGRTIARSFVRSSKPVVRTSNPRRVARVLSLGSFRQRSSREHTSFL